MACILTRRASGGRMGWRMGGQNGRSKQVVTWSHGHDRHIGILGGVGGGAWLAIEQRAVGCQQPAPSLPPPPPANRQTRLSAVSWSADRPHRLAHRQIGTRTDRQTGRWRDWRTNRLTERRQTDRQTTTDRAQAGRQTDRQKDRQTGQKTERQTVRQTHCHTGTRQRLTGQKAWSRYGFRV